MKIEAENSTHKKAEEDMSTSDECNIFFSNTNIESLLVFFKQLLEPEPKINRRHSFAWFCYQISAGLFSCGDIFVPFFSYFF